VGEKAWWLQQMLSAIPPSTWTRLWKQSPAELIETAAQGDWKATLHAGWKAATVNHRDTDWAEALMKVYPRETHLLAVFPAQRRENLLAAQLQAAPKDGLDLLCRYDLPWSAALSLRVVDFLRSNYQILADPNQLAAVYDAFRTIGRLMDPAILPEAIRGLKVKSEPNPTWERAVEELLTILDFRRQMNEELK
jgi:hypothetical protein